MGVVHKLRNEIVDFIVNQKKENPAIGCRALVKVVYDAFQVKVSKSSINSIIKNAHLSSHVGRPASEKKSPRKFQIPAETKKQLSADLAKMSKQDVLEPVAEEKVDVEKAKLQKEKAKGILYDCMGSIFLKAAQWDVSDVSILGKILQKHLEDKEGAYIDSVGEVLLLMQAFGISSIEELHKYGGEGLWTISGLAGKMDPENILSVGKGIDDFKGLSLDCYLEVSQALKEVQSIKISLEDSDEIWLNADLRSVLAKDAQPGYCVPFSKGINFLTNNVLNNAKPVVLQNMLHNEGAAKDQSEQSILKVGEFMFSPEFLKMASAFENISGKRITECALYDDDRQEIACFEAFIKKKRHFIASAWPGQPGFEGFLKTQDIKEESAVYVENIQQQVYYSEIAMDLNLKEGNSDSFAMRGFLLRDSSSGQPFVALVSNASSDQAPSKNIILDYLARWPNKHESFHFEGEPLSSSKREARPGFLAEDLEQTLSGVAKGLFACLNWYVQRKFFKRRLDDMDITSMISKLYMLPGRLEMGEQVLRVSLKCLEGQDPLRKAIEMAARDVNESAILDYEGRQLVLDFC